jgi:LPS export ABC transporter protein LptC
MPLTTALLAVLACVACTRSVPGDATCDDAALLRRGEPVGGAAVEPGASSDPAPADTHRPEGEAKWPEYVLHADSGWALIEGERVEICGVRLEARDSTGTLVTWITAERGTLDRASGTVVAVGDVVVRLPEQGRTLRTRELHWAPEQDRVWSPGPATLQSATTLLSGESFEADSRFENIHIRRARTRPAP